MKKFHPILLFIFLTTACAAGTQVPPVESTSTPLPTSIPTTIPLPTSTIELIVPTITPTSEPATSRVSLVDGMPQVYIPKGTFRMGGLDARSAPDEFPAHDVTLHDYWMD